MNVYRGVQTSRKTDFYSPTMWKADNNASSIRQNNKDLFPSNHRPLSNVFEEEVPIFFSPYNGEVDDYSRITDESHLAATATAPGPFNFLDNDMMVSPLIVSTTQHLSPAHHQKMEGSKESKWRQPPVKLPAQEFLKPMRSKPNDSCILPTLEEYPALTPRVVCPPPLMFTSHQPQACHAPVATLTGLLQDVLGIMNTMMSEQDRVQKESEMLMDLVELAAIMQEEAEALVEMADLVEEYTEEVEAAELEEWVQELDLGRFQSRSLHISHSHQRENSGVSAGEESDSGVGTSNETPSTHADFNMTGEEGFYQDEDPVHQSPLLEPTNEVMRAAKAVTLHRSGKNETRFRDSALDLLSPAGQEQRANPEASQ